MKETKSNILMQFLHFTFQSFWHFLGVVVLMFFAGWKFFVFLILATVAVQALIAWLNARSNRRASQKTTGHYEDARY